jgi:hypothetical protein
VLVLDANILIRAVLGARVLFLLRKYAAQVEFFAPDTAFEEARESLPAILARRRVPVAPPIEIWINWRDCVKPSKPRAAKTSRSSPASESRTVMRMWPPRWRCTAPFGPRTRTSSAAALQLGRRIWWNCIWRRRRRGNSDGLRIPAQCTGSAAARIWAGWAGAVRASNAAGDWRLFARPSRSTEGLDAR